jgi:AcrR family transcriptional regulator
MPGNERIQGTGATADGQDATASSPAGTGMAPGQPANGGRRERRRLEVRERLFTAAISLFAEQGFTATTMDDIAERADVARATVFYHFPQKISFLEEWGRHRRAQVAEILRAERAADRPVADQLRRYLGEMAKINLNARQESVVLMDAAARHGALFRQPMLDVELARLVERGRETGEIRPDVGGAQAGVILAIGYFSTVLRWIAAEPPPFSLPEELDSMLDIVLRGLLADPAASGVLCGTNCARPGWQRRSMVRS